MQVLVALFAMLSVVSSTEMPSKLATKGMNAEREGARKALAHMWAQTGGDPNSMKMDDPKLKELMEKFTAGTDMEEAKKKSENVQRIKMAKHQQMLLNPPRLEYLEKEYAEQLLKNPAAQPSADLLKIRRVVEHHRHMHKKNGAIDWNAFHTWVLVALFITIAFILVGTACFIYKENKKKDEKMKYRYDKLMGSNGKMPAESSTFLYNEDDDEDDHSLEPKPQDNPNLVRRNKVSLS